MRMNPSAICAAMAGALPPMKFAIGAADLRVEKAMSPLLVQFLRRLAVLALVLAALTAFGPRVLRELGVVGPKVQEAIAGAERSLAAARRYGADDAMPAVQEAIRRLGEARALAERGEG